MDDQIEASARADAMPPAPGSSAAWTGVVEAAGGVDEFRRERVSEDHGPLSPVDLVGNARRYLSSNERGEARSGP
ncbi:hypothetical protein [Streptomyces atratus]|uniref:hypothetical protein n=1 Tax=Streptomyces atratus TaxID=1893 RepID=UPI001C43522B|nr:hypothetical protein [Streptomyces atratus]